MVHAGQESACKWGSLWFHDRGEPALEVAQKVLSSPDLEGLELYSFKAAAKRDRLYIRIDKVGQCGGRLHI